MVEPLSRNQIAWRAAQDLEEGMVVNLGIGMPVLASSYAPAGREVIYQSENGIVGVGPEAEAGHADPDLVDAGSRNVTLAAGGTVIDSAGAFAMIRGGHIDVTLLGGFEVAANGDLANWDAQVPNKGQLVGGAMDLAFGAKAVRVMMQHNTKSGGPRLLKKCSLPLTAPGCVTRIYTDLAVVDVTAQGFVVQEILAGMSKDELQAKTDAPLKHSNDLKTLEAPADL
ncbi:MAG: 3-oxoacid CoA-transferase subunit B [Alphaproteobacteria bacterium]|nr:3-oxoacid CoA-transferase subunit B [Alphaproteobacteria bacterium]